MAWWQTHASPRKSTSFLLSVLRSMDVSFVGIIVTVTILNSAPQLENPIVRATETSYPCPGVPSAGA